MTRLFALAGALAVCLPLAPREVGAPTAPAPAADVRIVDLKGLEAAIAEHRGQAILLNFWAIWCEPCVAELPELLEVGRQFRGRNAVVLTVSYDLMVPDVTPGAVMKQMREFLASKKWDVPVFIYNAPDYDAINARFGLPGPIPATVAINGKGAVVATHSGKGGRDRFVELMKKALGG